MGTFKWPIRISSMDGQQALDVEATVDTGAAPALLEAYTPQGLAMVVDPTSRRLVPPPIS